MELGPVGARVLALSSRRRVRVAMGAAVGLSLATPLVPLANVPSYESALLANLLCCLFGGIYGIAAGRLEREAERGQAPAAVVRAPAALSAVASAGLAALWLTLFTVLLPVLLSALVAGTFGAACSLVRGLPWYPVLPLPSAALACALGVLVAASSERRFVPGLLFAGIVVASGVATALPVLTGPQVFLYNHLLAYLPGPLYDEVLSIGRPLLFYRLLTLAWAAAVLGVTSLCWNAGGLGAPRHRPLAAALTILLPCGLLAAHLNRHQLGYEQSLASVAEALGGRIEGERCTLLHPREMKLAEVRRASAECDLRVEQLEGFFGVAAVRPMVVLYRSPGEKHALVGAGGTQFAKPWLGQIHVDRRGWPHPVVKHELAHVVAGAVGRPPFLVASGLLGLVPIPALVEGVAVAADWPAGELTVHEQARAMRELKLLPELSRLFSIRGFFGESQRRAYTAAGSFVRWLVETRGSERFAVAYKDGDFLGAYGVPLPELVAGWHAFLDELPLPARARAIAERRFRRPAIFRRPCAREVAELAGKAGAALGAEDLTTATRLYGRCLELDPGDPGHLRNLAATAAREGEPAKVQALSEQLERHGSVDDLLRSEVLGYLGDAHFARGELPAAQAAYLAASALTSERAGERMLQVKIEAMADHSVAGAVLPYLAESSDVKLVAVLELLATRPGYGTGWYLVGRRLQQRDEEELAALYLQRALEHGLPSEALTREARNQLAVAQLSLERFGEACPALEALGRSGTPGERLEAEDLLSLCRFGAGRHTAAAR